MLANLPALASMAAISPEEVPHPAPGTSSVAAVAVRRLRPMRQVSGLTRELQALRKRVKVPAAERRVEMLPASAPVPTHGTSLAAAVAAHPLRRIAQDFGLTRTALPKVAPAPARVNPITARSTPRPFKLPEQAAAETLPLPQTSAQAAVPVAVLAGVSAIVLDAARGMAAAMAQARELARVLVRRAAAPARADGI